MEARQEGRDWLFTEIAVADLEQDAEQLQSLVNQLPGHLQKKLGSLAYNVRVQYRTAIVIAWSSLLLAPMMLGLFFLMFRKWIVFPLRALFEGSRKVADGNYDFRVHLETGDEMGRAGRGDEHMTARVSADSRRSGCAGSGADQAGRAERATGERRVSGGRRGPRDQQSAGVDRDVQRVAGGPPERIVRMAAKSEPDMSDRARLPGDDPARGVPLQGNHRETARLSRGWARPSGSTPKFGSWSRA